MPSILKRVVCGLFETAAIFSPTSRFSSVDLPAFGRPIRATCPARWFAARLFVWFWDIRWNNDLFRRDYDDLAVFPGGDGIAELLVHHERPANGSPQGPFDVLAKVANGRTVCSDSRTHF